MEGKKLRVRIDGEVREAICVRKYGGNIRHYSIQIGKDKYLFQYDSTFYRPECEKGNSWAQGYLMKGKMSPIDCYIIFDSNQKIIN